MELGSVWDGLEMVWKWFGKWIQNRCKIPLEHPQRTLAPTESKKRSGDFKTPPLHERSKKSFLRDQVEKTRLHIDLILVAK